MFGHVSPVRRGCLLGPVCLGISGSPVPELGSPLSYLSRRTLAQPGPNTNNGRETKHISCHLTYFPLALFLQANLVPPIFFFFFPLPFLATSPHELAVNICAKSSMDERTPCQYPANKGRLCSVVGSVPERCAFLC